MANWTAENIQISKTQVDFAFTADILRDKVFHHNYGEPHVSNFDSIPSIIKNHLAQYSAADNADETKVPVVIDLTPAEPIPPSDDEKAKVKFQQDLNLYRGMLVAIRLGLVAVDDKEIAGQLALVQSEFLPTYYPLLIGII